MGYSKYNYRFKNASCLNEKYAQAAGEMCEELSAEGILTPKTLVDRNRDEDAPLHEMFEWDDAVAGELYRQRQAGHIIRCLETVVVDNSEPVRSFFAVNYVNRENSGYLHIQTILNDEDTYSSLLNTALTELIAFKKKYESLKELECVFSQITLLIESKSSAA